MTAGTNWKLINLLNNHPVSMNVCNSTLPARQSIPWYIANTSCQALKPKAYLNMNPVFCFQYLTHQGKTQPEITLTCSTTERFLTQLLTGKFLKMSSRKGVPTVWHYWINTYWWILASSMKWFSEEKLWLGCVKLFICFRVISPLFIAFFMIFILFQNKSKGSKGSK